MPTRRRRVTPSVTECCTGNNRFALRGIRFTDTRPITTYPVALPFDAPASAGGGRQTLAEPYSDYFDLHRAMWPGRINVVSVLAPVDVTDVYDAGLTGFDAVDGFIADVTEAYGDSTVPGKILGLNPTPLVCAGKGLTPIGATGCADRAPILVAHESGHTYGLAHAMSLGACDSNALIGARADRQPLNGVGVDLRYWSGGAPGLFQPLGEEKAGVFDAAPDASVDLYDYMSYCALAPTAGCLRTTGRRPCGSLPRAGASTPTMAAIAASSAQPPIRPYPGRTPRKHAAMMPTAPRRAMSFASGLPTGPSRLSTTRSIWSSGLSTSPRSSLLPIPTRRSS